MNRENRSALFWGALLILLGIGWLLKNFGYLDQGIFRLWPLLLVGGGVWMLARSFTARQGGGLVAAVCASATDWPPRPPARPGR